MIRALQKSPGLGMARVLVVEDEATQRELLVTVLGRAGYDVVGVGSAESALEVIAAGDVDLVLLDLHLPDGHGGSVLEILRASDRTRLLPIIIVSGDATEEEHRRALAAGVTDFLHKPFDLEGLIRRIEALVRLKLFADGFEHAEVVLVTLAGMLDARDPCTAGHSERVSRHAEALGRRIGLDEDTCGTLRRGGLFHDIGKIAVRDAVLHKEGRLTPTEMAEMQRHPAEGRRVVQALHTLEDTIPIVYHHHEKLDGSGYPEGLSGDAVPLVARIASIVDVFDALTTSRPYRPAFGRATAIEILQREAARGWWDRALVREFREMVVAERPVELDAARVAR